MKKLFKLRKLFIAITVFLIVLGINSFINIPKQENPDLGSLYTQIEITALGKSSEEIDKEVIIDINSKIAKVDGIGDVFSSSYDNFGIITATYDISVDDVSQVEVELTNAINSLSFEEDVNIEIIPYEGISDVLYAFKYEDLDLAYEFQEDLYSIEAVKNVSISEKEEPYYKVNLDNNVLSSYGLTSEIVTQILMSRGFEATLGIIDNTPVVTSNNFENIEEVSDVVITNLNGNLITLDMIGEVEKVEEKVYHNTLNGEDALFLSIQFDQDIDVTKVGQDVKDIHEDYPSFEVISFAPDYVEDSINQINSTLLVGMVLVMLVSIFSLGFRSALTILVTFPLTVFATILSLDLVNIPLQNISIAGLIISIGIIVDNAIVIVDAMIYELESGKDMDTSIKYSIKNNTAAIFSSTLTTIVAFTPLLFLPGVAGKMASSLPITVIVALICSFFSAIVVIPTIGSKLLKPRNRKQMKLLNRITTASLKFPKLNVFLVLILLVSSIVSVYLLQPIQLFPTAEKDYIYIDYKVSDSNDIDDVIEVSKLIEDNLNSDKVVSSVNYESPSFYSSLIASVATPNTGRVLYENASDNSIEISRMKEILNNELGNGVTFNVEEIMMNAPGAPIQVILYDIENTSLVVEDIKSLDGVESVQATEASTTSKYDFRLKEEYSLILTEGQVFSEVSRLINDTSSNVLDIDNISSELVVSNGIEDFDTLLNQIIVVDNTSYVLKDIVEVEEIKTPLVVNRIDYKISNTINVYVDSKYSVYEVHDEVTKVLEDSSSSYTIKGEKELTTTVFTDVFYAGVAAFIMIFLILLAQFNSFKNVFIILTSILFSLIGSALFIIIFNQPITFTATLGIVSLMGIVVNNGILLVDYIEKSKEESTFNKCVEAVKRRSRPIITSNVTTIIGLVPLVVVGSDFFRPMAITLVGGLIIAIPLSLCVIPSLYIILNKKSK